MQWVTRSHIHVDRVACPWLITRFIDNEADFLFVPASQIEKVAKEQGAIPYDAPGVELGHVDGLRKQEASGSDFELGDAALGESQAPPGLGLTQAGLIAHRGESAADSEILLAYAQSTSHAISFGAAATTPQVYQSRLARARPSGFRSRIG